MSKTKLGFALAMLALAAVAGMYFSGYLVLLLLKLHAPLKLTTYMEYWKALGLPQVHPYVGKIKVAGAIGLGLPTLGYLALLYPLFRPKPRSIHGDARFATRADLARAGLLKDSPTSIVLGKFGRDLVRLGGQQHAILTAPTRSGKTVGVAIPVLLTFEDSIVALDIKGELYAVTSGWRQTQGHQVFVWAPFTEDRITHRFNPFMCVSRDPDLRINQLQSIAAILYPDDPNKDAFWVNQSRSAFFAFALYMFENWDAMAGQGFPSCLDANTSPLFPSFERVYRLSSGEGNDPKTHLRKLMVQPFVGVATRTAFANLISQADETFSSILGSMQEPLHIFLNPILAAATNACDFDVVELRRRKMTVYVVVPPNKLVEARKILNIFFSMVLARNTSEMPGERTGIKHQCLLLMDEFTAMGRVDILAASISYTAGYGLRSLPIIQSLSQLDATYGADVARTFVTNHAASIVFAPREQRDAEEYSKMLGDTTVRRRQRSTSHGQGGSVSYTEVEERRELMKPQELKALGGDTQIIFYEGCAHPIKCSKIKYYSDKYFKERLLTKVSIPPLPTGDASMPSKITHAVTVAASMALAACAIQSTTASTPEQETHAMTATDSGSQAIKPKVTAEQVLLRVLELIRTSKTIQDFTPEKLTEVMELKLYFADGGNQYGAGQVLTPQWGYRFEFDRVSMYGPFFSFDFYEHPKDTNWSMTDICQMDTERFSTELESMGYTRQTKYGLHGSLDGYEFGGRGPGVTVYTRGESNENAGHRCIRMIEIR